MCCPGTLVTGDMPSRCLNEVRAFWLGGEVRRVRRTTPARRTSRPLRTRTPGRPKESRSRPGQPRCTGPRCSAGRRDRLAAGARRRGGRPATGPPSAGSFTSTTGSDGSPAARSAARRSLSGASGATSGGCRAGRPPRLTTLPGYAPWLHDAPAVCRRCVTPGQPVALRDRGRRRSSGLRVLNGTRRRALRPPSACGAVGARSPPGGAEVLPPTADGSGGEETLFTSRAATQDARTKRARCATAVSACARLIAGGTGTAMSPSALWSVTA